MDTNLGKGCDTTFGVTLLAGSYGGAALLGPLEGADWPLHSPLVMDMNLGKGCDTTFGVTLLAGSYGGAALLGPLEGADWPLHSPLVMGMNLGKGCDTTFGVTLLAGSYGGTALLGPLEGADWPLPCWSPVRSLLRARSPVTKETVRKGCDTGRRASVVGTDRDVAAGHLQERVQGSDRHSARV
ncbi:hypothetical protein [Candidatus Poriferisodalis sp.]|uniref:hypothetical protein n=1 Tax=Candidatus Poriferisodalis sp. TaxID=3101277 RepID=UPI003B02740C